LDWNVTTVGEEFYVELGKMLDAEKNVGMLKPFIGNRAVQWGKINTDDINEIRMSSTDMQRYRLCKGDLLVCEGGEVGRAAIWQEQIDECYYQKALHRLRAKHRYSHEFLAAVLQQYAFSGKLRDYVTQTSIAHFPKEKFVTLPIPKPATFNEQRRIAEALTDTDALIDSLEQLLTKKRQIKQGAMQELLTGKKRLPGFTSIWETVNLSQAGLFVRGVAYNPGVDLSESDGKQTVRLLRSSNVQDGKIVRSELQFVNRRRVRFDQYLQIGDLLLCMANGSRELVGKTGRYLAEDEHRYTFGAFMGCYRPDPKVIDPAFISFHFQTHAFRQHVDLLLAGSSINNLRPTDVLSFEVIVPKDHVEQRTIAKVLSHMDTAIATLEARLTKARALKQAMAQALLTGRIRLLEPTT